MKYVKCALKECENKFGGSGKLPLYCPDHNFMNTHEIEKEISDYKEENKEDWEKEMREKYDFVSGADDLWKDIKEFIHQTIKEEREKAQREALKKVEEKLSWLTRYNRCIFMPEQKPAEGEGMFDMLKEQEVLQILTNFNPKE